ncbi:hypothetical protein OFS94_25350, partial [Escherichia coli]|nr:hypothetical protein [Escherichia coli]
WDRLPTADPGGPATISSQAYAYYMQNVPFCIFVPTAHRDLSLPWVFTTAAGVVWDRLPTADPGEPATISSQAYAYYMQNVPFCIFVPTAHDDLSLRSHTLLG